MAEHLQVGDVLGRENYSDPGEPKSYDGFCGGEFGRDSYDLKVVEAIASDYVVCRTESGDVAFYAGNPRDLAQYVLEGVKVSRRFEVERPSSSRPGAMGWLPGESVDG